jgi:hypothetical protein
MSAISELEKMKFARLALQFQPARIPKPTALAVLDEDGRIIAWLDMEQAKAVMSNLKEMEEKYEANKTR